MNNSAAARANAARESCRARINRIVAEDDENRTCDCGARAIIVMCREGKTIRECLACGTRYNPATADMSIDEILEYMEAM